MTGEYYRNLDQQYTSDTFLLWTERAQTAHRMKASSIHSQVFWCLSGRSLWTERGASQRKEKPRLKPPLISCGGKKKSVGNKSKPVGEHEKTQDRKKRRKKGAAPIWAWIKEGTQMDAADAEQMEKKEKD